ncbi:aldo/keto reductase [Nonomuraea cypriaca]|uniref:aldo/keto reductase n=1 Tax=Nonomuraea cypriaca TaxID=1187855 RepID=UPI002E2E7037|nr:aldo/keto reductase [Nonomuraea cypriaca]
MLRQVAEETGASVNQVVLAWQIGSRLPMIPLAGASSVAQLEENLAAVDLNLTEDQRSRLDSVH